MCFCACNSFLNNLRGIRAGNERLQRLSIILNVEVSRFLVSFVVELLSLKRRNIFVSYAGTMSIFRRLIRAYSLACCCRSLSWRNSIKRVDATAISCSALMREAEVAAR